MHMTIVSRGIVAHTGQVSPLGASSATIGQVEVRLGDVVEMPDGSRIGDFIALEYRGTLAPQSKWLQFVWFEMSAMTAGGTIQLSGPVSTSSGFLSFTTNPSKPNWAIDSGPTDPFYESGALSIRSLLSTTIFDRPGGLSVGPLAQAVFARGLGARRVTFTAHFETYLICRDVAVYQVAWSASTTFTSAKAGSINYSVDQAGTVIALPASLRGILHLNYPTYWNVR